MPRPKRKKLGETLVEAGLVDDLQLRSALADQKRWGNRLGKTLVKLGFIEEAPLMRQLSQVMGYPLAEIEGREIDPEVLDLIPRGLAQKHRCLPLFVDDDGASRYLYLGMEEPADLDILDALQLRTGLEICPVLIGFRALDAALQHHYGLGLDLEAGREVEGAEFEIAGALVGPDCLRHGAEELETAAPVAEPPAQAAAEPAPRAAPERAGEIPTRRILQALTQLLMEKDVFTRDELLEQVRALAERDGG